jgi:outer membrane biosynthesis protein TonB
MMASDVKKTKADPAPKKEATPPKKEAAPADKSTPEAAPSKADTPKTDGGETATAAPKNYSRGEGQKPVTQAYKDNWNAIFGKKKR